MSAIRDAGEKAFRILKAVNEDTPDFFDLAKSNTAEFAVFVPGHLRRHYRYDEMMEGCNYYGQAVTWDSMFILKEGPFETKDYHPEPLMFHLGKTADERMKTTAKYETSRNMSWAMAGRVEGDVYGVPLRKLTQLDRWNDNTRGTVRTKVAVILEDAVQAEAPSVYASTWITDWDYYQAFHDRHKMYLKNCLVKSKRENGVEQRTFYFHDDRGYSDMFDEDYYSWHGRNW